MARYRTSSVILASRPPRPIGGHIVRIHDPSNHTTGWQARRSLGKALAGRREVRKYASRFYADRKYGGKDAAYNLAVLWLRGAA